MSAGNFVYGKYEADNGAIYDCRRQPETTGLILNGQANTEPAGDVDQAGSARLTGSRRKYGVRAREVRVRFTAAPPTGYSPDDILTIPVFTPAAYNAMTAVKRPTGTYLGTAVVFVGKTGESVR